MEVAQRDHLTVTQDGAAHTLTLLAFAGPTGGHLFPAQAFSECLRRRQEKSDIYLVTSRKGEKLVAQMPPGLFRGVFYLEEFPFPSGISLRSIAFLLKLPKVFLASANLLFRLKPDVCVGFGSYVSFPGMLVAALLKIPTLIHEQNLIPGRATRFLASRVDGVAVSFDQTFLGAKLRSRYVTGLPLRSQLRQGAKNAMTKKKEKFCVLIVGGSQGAHRLNELVLEALGGLDSAEKEKMAVTHIAGLNDFAGVRESYKKMEIESDVFPFYVKMEGLYQRADLAVTRAGANTLFELSFFRLPAIVIPYPYAEVHQAANAAYFESRQAVICKTQDTLSAEELRQEIRHLRDSPEDCRRLSKKIGDIFPADAGERLVDLTEHLLAGAGRAYEHC